MSSGSRLHQYCQRDPPNAPRSSKIWWWSGWAATPDDWVYPSEFNLSQDLAAGQVLFDCGVPLVQIPAFGVTNFLITTVPELEACLAGKNKYLRLPGGQRKGLFQRSLRLVQGNLGCRSRCLSGEQRLDPLLPDSRAGGGFRPLLRFLTSGAIFIRSVQRYGPGRYFPGPFH